MLSYTSAIEIDCESWWRINAMQRVSVHTDSCKQHTYFLQRSSSLQ